MRPSWKGYLTVNLVSFPVQAYNALESGKGEIHFHQLHAPDHNRIRYKKVCPVHGEVTNDEIVSGAQSPADPPPQARILAQGNGFVCGCATGCLSASAPRRPD